MSEKEFNAITPRSFFNKIKGYRRAEEVKFKNGWEKTRAIIVAGMMPHLGKGSTKKPEKIYPLPWDGNQKTKTVNPKLEAKKASDFWSQIDKKQQKK